jgi:hypothetical protein
MTIGDILFSLCLHIYMLFLNGDLSFKTIRTVNLAYISGWSVYVNFYNVFAQALEIF